MSEVSYKKITEARARIAGLVQTTPVLPSVLLENETGRKISLKLENLNISGSFKIRGASNALLSASREVLQNGVLAASAGNHAQGVATVSRLLGVKATIFMPERTPLIKIERTRALGAEVRLVGSVFDEAYEAAQMFHNQSQGRFIHPYAEPDVINGQGTCGLELLEQVEDLETVIVPVGGGGLISGVACAIKEVRPGIRIIGVQSAAFPAMKMSFESGQHVKQKPIVTIADGIAVKTVHERNLKLVRKYVDEIVTVEEDEIAGAIMFLMERNHLLVEGAGAVPIAALLKYHRKWSQYGGTTALIVSGGNIDMNLLRRVMSRGLISSGRLTRLRFTLADKPGALAGLLQVISMSGANVNEIHHERSFSSSHYNDVQVDAVLETSDPEHRESVFRNLKDNGIEFEVTS